MRHWQDVAVRILLNIVIDLQAQGQLVHHLGILASIKAVVEVTGLSYSVEAEGRGACSNLWALEGQPISLVFYYTGSGGLLIGYLSSFIESNFGV